eukprot:m.20244 g.20244  ORF g.20244 m.20244 type:complete len:93 (+) comp27992_c0_seq2:89-367(+)
MGEAKIGITLDVFLEGKSALLKCYCYQGKTTFESLLNANEREIQELGHLEKLRNGGTTEIARIQVKNGELHGSTINWPLFLICRERNVVDCF